MINWTSVVANSFWIVGLAFILAGLSYYYWLAGQTGRSFQEEIGNLPFQRVAVSGLLLVGIGLLLTADKMLQIVPAAALIIVCLISLATLLRQRHHNRPGG